ncbi:hypothetical protein Glo7428_0179 [Gloeocapsa sp. PCC 7428]|uniref:hypothetical protein n=1 Tax=Gloeocapsa sp. PCC 7428 TaxID=1173026 RepID=UPI0002A5EC3B|nr:hypothetical protein [Gloeocapsa sp. PCC 7428]AFZ28789.1 hypothetical protein Glo7428_0179 [Gloeocapsa sp. PCC 7428]
MVEASRFKQVLESVELLSMDEQEVLVEIIRHRLVERRRDEIAANIAQAQEEYRTGNVFRRTVDQILDELRQ